MKDDKPIIPAVYFEDYEIISDTLLPLGSSAFLKMNVRLTNTSKDNERLPMANEYLYRTNKYIDKAAVISVKRKFFPYLSIEFPDGVSDINGKGKIPISHYDILAFQSIVNDVDEELIGSFGRKKDKIFLIREKVFHKEIVLSEHNAIRFEPTVITDRDEDLIVGVRMTMSGRFYVDIPIRTWKAFVYYIRTVDLYGWASTIVSGYTSNTVGHNVTDMQTISKNPTLQEEPVSEQFGFKSTKPISKEEKIKNFFSD